MQLCHLKENRVIVDKHIEWKRPDSDKHCRFSQYMYIYIYMLNYIRCMCTYIITCICHESRHKTVGKGRVLTEWGVYEEWTQSKHMIFLNEIISTELVMAHSEHMQNQEGSAVSWLLWCWLSRGHCCELSAVGFGCLVAAAVSWLLWVSAVSRGPWRRKGRKPVNWFAFVTDVGWVQTIVITT